MIDLIIGSLADFIIPALIGVLLGGAASLVVALFPRRRRDGTPGLFAVPVPHPGARVKVLNGEPILTLPGQEEGLAMSDAAARCWDLLDGRTNVLKVARRIGGEYRISTREAIADVRRFVHRLKEALLALEASEWALVHTHESDLFAGRTGSGIEEWRLTDGLIAHGAACLRAPDGSLGPWRGTARQRRAGARAMRAHLEREVDLEEAAREFEKGWRHCSAGRLAEAEASFRRSAALAPEWANAHYQLGYVGLRRRRYREARRWLERADELSPGLFMVREYLEQARRLAAGEISHEAFLLIDRANAEGLRDPDRTILLARRALQISPDYPSARLVLARAYQKKSQLDKALRELSRAIRANPDPATLCHALLSRGSIFMAQGRPEMAMRELEKVIEIDGSAAATRTALATMADSRWVH